MTLCEYRPTAAVEIHELRHNHACEFQLWGWRAHGLPPVNLGLQTLQIMDHLTMDLSEFVRIELVRMTGIQEESTIMKYVVTFDRIGRNHVVQPLVVESANRLSRDDIEAHIDRYARKFLASRDVDVTVDLESGRGDIFAGIQSGGTFTVRVDDGRVPA
jgi:hypothetical protein